MPGIESAIREKYRTSDDYRVSATQIGDLTGLCIEGSPEAKSPKWAAQYSKTTGLQAAALTQSPGAVIVLPIKQDNPNGVDAWAITFGVGFQMLDQKYVDTGFGLAVAIRCAKPNELNSLSKLSMDNRPRMERSTIPSGSRLRNFGFEELGEIASRVVASAVIPTHNGDTQTVRVRAADALNIPLPTSPSDLIRMLKEIESILKLEPVDEELRVIEQLKKVRDKQIISNLDQMLVDALCEAPGKTRRGVVELSYPHELTDEYRTPDSHKIYGTGRAGSFDDFPVLDSFVSQIAATDPARRIEKLDAMSVTLFEDNGGHIASPKLAARKWLSAEFDLNGSRYALYGGKWLRFTNTYASTIQQRVKDVFSTGPYLHSIGKWPATDHCEACFNVQLADRIHGLALDADLVRTETHRHGIESCDILLQDGTFVHVKDASSSSPVSHLLAQALVSADAFKNDPTAREALADKIRRLGLNPGDFTLEPTRVVIVIANESRIIGPGDLFSFSQVNLVRQANHLMRQGVDVHIAPILRERGPKVGSHPTHQLK